MKVLHVNNVANVANGLTKGLKKIGIDAQLYQPYTGINKAGNLGKLSVIGNRMSDIIAIAKRVRKEKYDIVHIHYAYFGVLGILGGYPYWLHCHGTDIRRNLNHPIYGKPTNLSLAKAEHVLYSTPDLKTFADKVRSDAAFLPNPIETNLFKPRNFSGPGGKILLISRVDKVKGIDIAFGALEKLKERNPTVQVDAFAWGPDLDRFRNKDFVNFIPLVDHEKLGDLISNYQVVIGQFSLGIMGMSELEAMACARPVISRFDYQQWYDETPPLVQAKDESDIVEQIEELLANPKRCDEIGLAGRDWVVKYHDYISIAERLAKLYESNR